MVIACSAPRHQTKQSGRNPPPRPRLPVITSSCVQLDITNSSCCVLSSCHSLVSEQLVCCRFTITVFFMLLFWALSGLAAIGHALIFERSMACLPPPLFIEVIVSIVLAFMLYTAAVSLSVLHSSVGRLFPDRCTASDANYLKLCAVVGLIWLQAAVMLVAKVTTRVASAVQSALLTAEERANAAQAGGFGSSPVAVRETELTDWS